jgi:Glycosyl hydrolase catalytic core
MNYINQCVTRYGNTADAWEICNEPNHDAFFINGTGSWASNNLTTSPQDQKRQQYKRQVGQALQQAGIAGKLLTTSGWADGGSWDSGFTAWLATQGNFLTQFSVCNVHAYGWPNYGLLASEPANRHAEGVQAGITWNDIWITEHGIHDDTGGGDASDKAYLIRSYAYALQQPRVKKLFWFQGSWDPNHQNLLTQADVRSPRFYAYKTMTEKWANPTQFVSYSNGNVRGTIANLASGSRMAILWCDSGTPAISSLGLNVAAAWNQDGTSISTSTGIGSQPVFVGLSD